MLTTTAAEELEEELRRECEKKLKEASNRNGNAWVPQRCKLLLAIGLTCAILVLASPQLASLSSRGEYEPSVFHRQSNTLNAPNSTSVFLTAALKKSTQDAADREYSHSNAASEESVRSRNEAMADDVDDHDDDDDNHDSNAMHAASEESVRSRNEAMADDVDDHDDDDDDDNHDSNAMHAASEEMADDKPFLGYRTFDEPLAVDVTDRDDADDEHFVSHAKRADRADNEHGSGDEDEANVKDGDDKGMSAACLAGFAYHGAQMINDNAGASDGRECLALCDKEPACKFWDHGAGSYGSAYCRLRSDVGKGAIRAPGYVAGRKGCKIAPKGAGNHARFVSCPG